MSAQSVIRTNGGTDGSPVSDTATDETIRFVVRKPAHVPRIRPVTAIARCSKASSHVSCWRDSPMDCKKPISLRLLLANNRR